MGIACVLPIGFIAFLLTINYNRYEADIVAMVEREFGIPVEIRGDISLKPALVPTIRIEDIRSANASWAARGDLVRIGRIDLSPELLPLFARTLIIKRLAFNNVEINLETNEDGNVNWGPERPAEVGFERQPTDEPPFPAIRQLTVEDMTVRLRYGAVDIEKTYLVESLTARSNGFDQPITMSLRGTTESGDISVEGTLGSAAALSRNEVFPVDLKGGLAGMDLAVVGEIQAPRTLRKFDVQFELESDSAAEFASFAGYEVDVKEPVRITARATGDRNGFTPADVIVRLGPIVIKWAE